jgi:hypothetical protein
LFVTAKGGGSIDIDFVGNGLSKLLYVTYVGSEDTNHASGWPVSTLPIFLIIVSSLALVFV